MDGHDPGESALPHRASVGPWRSLRPVRLLGWLSVVLVSGCLAPSFAELGSEVCRDGDDQDRDGLVDCEDDDCASSGVCEHLDGTCSDDRDNDGDKLRDCSDPDCSGEEPCLARDAECSPIDGTGCTHGLACYMRPEGDDTECRLPGKTAEFESCDAASKELSAEDSSACEPGTGCQIHAPARRGLCSRYCMRDENCLFGGQCLGSDGDVPGLCTVPCDPQGSSGCPQGFVCLAGQAVGISRAAGGYRYRCVEEGAFPREDFITDEEALCADPENGVLLPSEQVCEPGRLCWGSQVDELRCPVLCYLDAPESGCAADERCVDVSHPGGTPVGALNRAFGVCVKTLR